MSEKNPKVDKGKAVVTPKKPQHKPAIITRFRKYSLALAESFDAWRFVPRMVLIIYSALVVNLYLWFKSIPTFVQDRCDPQTLKIMLEMGKSIEDAKMLACTVVDVVGGPTAAQSAFVTTIVGLSAAIFGLYTTSGRRWDAGLPPDINNDITNSGNTTVVIAKKAKPKDNNDENLPPEEDTEEGNGPEF